MKMNPLRQKMKVLFSFMRAMNFQSLHELCGSSILEIIRTFGDQLEATVRVPGTL